MILLVLLTMGRVAHGVFVYFGSNVKLRRFTSWRLRSNK